MEARFRRLAERIQSSLKADRPVAWQKASPKPLIPPGPSNRQSNLVMQSVQRPDLRIPPVSKVNSEVVRCGGVLPEHVQKYRDLNKLCERVERIQTESSTSSLSTSTSNSSAVLQAAAAKDVEKAVDDVARTGFFQPRYELPDSVRTQATVLKRNAPLDSGIFPPVQNIESLNSLPNMLNGFATSTDVTKSYSNPKNLIVATTGATPAMPARDLDRCPLCRQRITPIQKKQATTLTSPSLEPRSSQSKTHVTMTAPTITNIMPPFDPPIPDNSRYAEVLSRSDHSKQSVWLSNCGLGKPTAPAVVTSTQPSYPIAVQEWQERVGPPTVHQLTSTSTWHGKIPGGSYVSSYPAPPSSITSVMTAPSPVSVPKLLHAQYIRQSTPPPRRRHSRISTWQDARSQLPPVVTRHSEIRKLSSSTSSTVAPPRDSIPHRISWQFNQSPLVNRSSQESTHPGSLDFRNAFPKVNPSPLASASRYFQSRP